MRTDRRAARRGGFTLIELLLVLVILATLAAIVVPKFAGRGEQARETAVRTDLRQMETAIDAFEVDCGRYPAQSEGFEALAEQPADEENWRGPYLKSKAPRDPWGTPYAYRYPGRENKNGFDIYSYGPDKREGSDDDLGNWDDED